MKTTAFYGLALTVATEAMYTNLSHNDKTAQVFIETNSDSGYTCDNVKSIFEIARSDCAEGGCSDTYEECDDYLCVTIDALTEVADLDVRTYMDDIETLIGDACIFEQGDEGTCTPGSTSCGTTSTYNTTVPAYMNFEINSNDHNKVANYKVVFSNKDEDSGCDEITSMLSTAIGPIDGSGYFGGISLFCDF